MAAAYDWVLDASPRTDSIAHVQCLWRFRRGHFELLEITITAVADPQYLAETLALGVDAAGLRGWSEGDTQSVYAWLLNLLNQRPLDHWVRATNRRGHVLVEALRLPHSRTEFKVRGRIRRHSGSESSRRCARVREPVRLLGDTYLGRGAVSRQTRRRDRAR